MFSSCFFFFKFCHLVLAAKKSWLERQFIKFAKPRIFQEDKCEICGAFFVLSYLFFLGLFGFVPVLFRCNIPFCWFFYVSVHLKWCIVLFVCCFPLCLFEGKKNRGFFNAKRIMFVVVCVWLYFYVFLFVGIVANERDVVSCTLQGWSAFTGLTTDTNIITLGLAVDWQTSSSLNQDICNLPYFSEKDYSYADMIFGL